MAHFLKNDQVAPRFDQFSIILNYVNTQVPFPGKTLKIVKSKKSMAKNFTKSTGSIFSDDLIVIFLSFEEKFLPKYCLNVEKQD